MTSKKYRGILCLLFLFIPCRSLCACGSLSDLPIACACMSRTARPPRPATRNPRRGVDRADRNEVKMLRAAKPAGIQFDQLGRLNQRLAELARASGRQRELVEI